MNVENVPVALVASLNIASTSVCIPTNVTASGVPAINPSCVVNGIPAAGFVLCNTCGTNAFTTLLTPLSSAFKIPN